MELDDLKNVKDRFMPSGYNNVEFEKNLSQIAGSFRIYESQVKRKKLLFVSFNTILAVIYLALMNHYSGTIATGFSLLGTGFALGAIYLYLRYKPMSPRIYSLPITEFLKKAQKKINYFNALDYVVIIPLLMLFGTGGGVVFISSFLKYTDNFTLLLLIWIAFYLFLLVFGFYAGRKEWIKEFGSLYEDIKKIRDSIDNNRISQAEI